MPHPTSEDLAYAAGIIDGEGCIRIAKNCYRISRGWPTNYAMTVQVLTTDHVIVPWMHEMFGGSVRVYENRRPVRGSNGKERRWYIASAAADKFIRQILPWLKLKKAQAELALEFRKLIGARGQSIAEDNRTKREALFQEMKALKRLRIG